MLQRKATAAEVSLTNLKNCLVNLPASLVSLLESINTVRTTQLVRSAHVRKFY